MAEENEDEMVKIELELPKDKVSIEPSEEGGSEDDEEKKQQSRETAGSSKPGKEEKSNDSEEPKVAGYKLSDLVKAPLEPPEPDSKRPPNKSQKVLISSGFGLAIGGLLAWPFTNLSVALTLIIAGAVLVAAGALVRF